MSKSVVLVLEPNHESEYGEYANTPVFNAHGNIVGWTGGEVPESGHPCEFNVLNDEGFTSCASSTTVNKLRDENTKLRELVRQVVEYVHKEHLSHEDISFWSDRENGVFRRMRELGVRLDG
jgi:hypothetical protein